MTNEEKTPIEKLATMLETVIGGRKEKQREVQSAQAILLETPPDAFDDEAAARAVAQARVADLMNNTNGANIVESELEQKRVAAAKAAVTHQQRQDKARKQLADTTRLVEALTVQATEVDTALRREFAAASIEWGAAAEQALADAAAKFLKDYVNYTAMTWLRRIDGPGDGRKQFYFPDQYEVTLSAPKEILDTLPSGYHSGLGEAIVYSRQEMMAFINERVREIMGEQSSGLYPGIGAGLNVARNALGLPE